MFGCTDAEVNTFNFWKEPFEAIANSKQLVTNDLLLLFFFGVFFSPSIHQTAYTVLDVELTGPAWGKYALADVELAREHELGSGALCCAATAPRSARACLCQA